LDDEGNLVSTRRKKIVRKVAVLDWRHPKSCSLKMKNGPRGPFLLMSWRREGPSVLNTSAFIEVHRISLRSLSVLGFMEIRRQVNANELRYNRAII